MDKKIVTSKDMYEFSKKVQKYLDDNNLERLPEGMMEKLQKESGIEHIKPVSGEMTAEEYFNSSLPDEFPIQESTAQKASPELVKEILMKLERQKE